MKSKTDIKTLSVRVESSTLSKLMAIAKKQKRTRTSLIRFALAQWIEWELKDAQ